MDPVALTALMVAAARAREHERPDRLFSDPYAAVLAGEEGTRLLADLDRASGDLANSPYFAIRVRFFDDLLLKTVSSADTQQVVLLAAGMDTRAFRLLWPTARTKVYELDRRDVLVRKDATLQSLGAVPRCTRHRLDVDLTLSWGQALQDAGFDHHRPSIWLAEGLLQYLDGDAVRHVLVRSRNLPPRAVCWAALLGARAPRPSDRRPRHAQRRSTPGGQRLRQLPGADWEHSSG